MLPGPTEYGSSSEDEEVKPPLKRKRRAWHFDEKLEVVKYCVEECGRNTVATVRTTRFNHVVLSLNIDGSQDHKMKFQGQPEGKPEGL